MRPHNEQDNPNNIPTESDIARTTRTASQLKEAPGVEQDDSNPPYVQRMYAEREQLAERYAALGAFMETEQFGELSDQMRDLMQAQYEGMGKYGEALQARLELYESTATETQTEEGAIDDDETPAADPVEDITDPEGGGTPNDPDPEPVV